MKYEKPGILRVHDAAKAILQMLKDVIAEDSSNGANQPAAFPSEE